MKLQKNCAKFWLRQDFMYTSYSTVSWFYPLMQYPEIIYGFKNNSDSICNKRLYFPTLSPRAGAPNFT